jgi:HlyD family secretion protein
MTTDRRMALTVVAIAVLLALLAGTDGFGLWKPRDSGLTLYGNVDIRQVDLAFRVSGRIAQMPLEEGVKVKAGTRLALLDTRPLEDRLAAASAQLELAEAELSKRRNGNRPQEIAQASAALAQQRANLAKALADYERRKPLLETGAISKALFVQTEAAYRAAQAQVDAQEQELSLQRAGSRVEDLAAATAQLANARAQRASAETDLADAVLSAPSDGTLLIRVREPGAIVQAGETVFTLTIDDPVRVRAYVSESDLHRLAPGMSVNVNVDGNPMTFRGAIGYISPTAEFTPKTVETTSLRSDLVYRLRINIEASDGTLRQGQPVTVSVPAALAAQSGR